MNCLLSGANLANKGSELMVRSAVANLRERHPSWRACLSPAVRGLERVDDLDLPLLDFPLPHVGQFHRFAPVFLGRGLWRLARRRPGEVAWSDIRALLDVSGFVCSDQWGLPPVLDLALLVRSARRRGARVVLLPQAFGPFDRPGMRSAMARVLEASDLVFARDAESHRHLLAIRDDRERIREAPDITLALASRQEAREDYCCIVPNERLLDKGRETWGERYEEVLAELVGQILRGTDLEAWIVVHDASGDDDAVARRLSEQVGTPRRVRVIEEDDPVKLKGILARSRFVIGSRFHALASALSCAVPSVALGWSHKYRQLFEQFGVGEWCFLRPDPELAATVEALLPPSRQEELAAALWARLQTLVTASEEMWDTIDGLLGT